MRVDMKCPRLIRREGLLSVPVPETEHTENSRLREMARVKVKTHGPEDEAEKQGSVA